MLTPKQKFKKAYSEFREDQRHFEQRLQGMHCGQDDAACEGREHYLNKFYKEHPAIGYAQEIGEDFLWWRVDLPRNLLKGYMIGHANGRAA